MCIYMRNSPKVFISLHIGVYIHRYIYIFNRRVHGCLLKIHGAHPKQGAAQIRPIT